ncbi:hypothetical protein MYX76_02410 [Desulfobacterota bacterium AH_259_B03_O07]|nr:hypothetical protein [Desulfobacterota bacterium AH_259_B03_O07]
MDIKDPEEIQHLLEVDKNLQSFYSFAIVDVRYFGDDLFDFKWAFKKLPKSIPKALKKDLGLG